MVEVFEEEFEKIHKLVVLLIREKKENIRGGGGVVRGAVWGCWGGVLGAWIDCDGVCDCVCDCDCDCELEGNVVCKIPWEMNEKWHTYSSHSSIRSYSCIAT